QLMHVFHYLHPTVAFPFFRYWLHINQGLINKLFEWDFNGKSGLPLHQMACGCSRLLISYVSRSAVSGTLTVFSCPPGCDHIDSLLTVTL
ncbi:hypothetical protein ABVT39_001195, partial [Epinephelus coioides]